MAVKLARAERLASMHSVFMSMLFAAVRRALNSWKAATARRLQLRGVLFRLANLKLGRAMATWTAILTARWLYIDALERVVCRGGAITDASCIYMAQKLSESLQKLVLHGCREVEDAAPVTCVPTAIYSGCD